MADFKPFLPHIFKWEGGYGNYVQDTGGCTMRGITIATWQAFGYDKDGDGVITCNDVKLITEEDAAKIYYERFWKPNGGDDIKTQLIAEIFIDWIINSGAGIAVPRVQKILVDLGQNIKVDGGFGKETLKAINNADQLKLYKAIWAAREKFYKDITAANPSYNIFIDGWLNRINSFPKDPDLKKK